MSAISSFRSDISMYGIQFLQLESFVFQLFLKLYPSIAFLEVELFKVDDGLDLAEGF